MTIRALPDHPFRSRDAATYGLTRRQLERAAAQGEVRRQTRGVYVRADLPDSFDLRAQALALVVSPHHVAINRTAGWLHGLDALTMSEHDLLPPVETCALRGRNPTRRPEADGRTRDLAPEDITTVAGVRATTPLRTALDLGCELRQREALASMVMLARRHGLTATDLAREPPRFRRRRGVIQCRALVPLVDPRLESEREAWTLLEIKRAGLPLPEPQWWVLVDGVPTYRLDFAYVHAKVCVEYDGFDDHHATPEQRAHDAARRDWLRQEGWIVIVVRRGDFTGAALDRWLREVRQALATSYTNRRW